MEERTKTVRLLVPTPARSVRRLESRGVELNNLAISLLGNGKESAQIFFDRFEELFSHKFSGTQIHRFRKRIHSIPCDFFEEIVACSNLVINATAE